MEQYFAGGGFFQKGEVLGMEEDYDDPNEGGYGD